MGQYKSADEILAAVPKRSNGRVDGTKTMELMIKTSREWFEPGVFMLFTGKELAMDGMEWCFGCTRTGKRVAVESTA